MKIHFLAMLLMTGFGFYFGISKTEWAIVVLCFGMVMAAEGFNSAIERLVDLAHPGRHPQAGKIKDMAAGAVLLAALSAAVAGALIFGKYFFAES